MQAKFYLTLYVKLGSAIPYNNVALLWSFDINY